MAPKQEKAKVAAKQKVAEDKTFGLKNKNKSTKVQKYVQQVHTSATAVSQKDRRLAETTGDAARKKKKELEEAREKELAALFAVAIKQPKVPPGVDPKSIVCEFFRHGQCTKSFKCKFSHDLSVERKGAKIDLFTDQRSLGEDGDEANMDEWDQEMLEKVVKEKHGAEKVSNATSIICKFFLEAVEKKQYGWFWKCPNGSECKYRHALPPGYVLKSQMKELLEEEAANRKDVVDVIEEERAKVDAKTPITEAVFQEWRRKRIEANAKKREEEEAERRRKGVMNGREIFLQEGFEAADDAGAAADYERDHDDEAEIKAMLERAAEEAAQAATQGVDAPQSEAAPAATTTTLKAEDFDDDMFDDDDDDDDDGDLDDEELDALEGQVREAHIASS